MLAPPRPTELHRYRVRLTRKPAAAAEARNQVRAALCAWRARTEPDIAILFTSDLVTGAIMHGRGQTITLAIRCSSSQLRVECYDASADEPVATRAPSHGLALVTTLATEWGTFLTPAGRVDYFTLAFDCDPHDRQRSGYRWIKSSLSYANGNCVEVANLLGGQIGVRNSRDSAGPVLQFRPGSWHAFLGGVRAGEFGGDGSQPASGQP